MLKNIAVLIDADNLSSQNINWIFDQINKLGTITTKRIYGDFTKPHLSSWGNYILEHAIEKKHQTSYSTGKNSSDIALVIDAMDLLHSRNCDAFCIVSSDSDFIGLALRLRQNNIQVFGFGETKAIKEFRQVCSQFFEIPDSQKSNIHPHQTNTIPIVTKYTASQLKSDTKLLNALRNSIQQCLQNGWANYGTVNVHLLNHYSNLSPQQYGYSKWSDIILKIDLFIGENKKGGLFICLKNNSNPTTSNSNKSNATKLKQDTALINAIRDSIHQHSANGWTNYSQISTHLKSKYPNIKLTHYGYSKWINLIQDIDFFEVKISKSAIFIREKSSNNPVQTIKTNNIINTNTVKSITSSLKHKVMHMIHNAPSIHKDHLGYTNIEYIEKQLNMMGIIPIEYGCNSTKSFLYKIGCILK